VQKVQKFKQDFSLTLLGSRHLARPAPLIDCCRKYTFQLIAVVASVFFTLNVLLIAFYVTQAVFPNHRTVRAISDAPFNYVKIMPL